MSDEKTAPPTTLTGVNAPPAPATPRELDEGMQRASEAAVARHHSEGGEAAPRQSREADSRQDARPIGPAGTRETLQRYIADRAAWVALGIAIAAYPNLDGIERGIVWAGGIVLVAFAAWDYIERRRLEKKERKS